MKKILVFAFILLPAFLFAQNSSLQSFFDKYAGHSGFTTVKISPKMFELLASVDVEEEALEAIRDITGLNVLVWENEDGKDELKAQSLAQEAFNALGSGFEELLSVKEEMTDIKILAGVANDGIIHDLLIVGSDEGEFIFVSITGIIDIKKISSLADDIEIDGIEHLKELEKETEEE